MTLQGVILLASVFGPPIVGLLIFLRAGLPLLRSFINALYLFAVCMLTFLGLFLFKQKLGMSDDELVFVLPVVCLGVLMAPHFKHRSPANGDERDESPEERNLP
jgi:hypothetical protein